MTPPLVIFRRATFETTLEVADAAGVIIPLTDCTARSQIRSASGALIATLSPTIPTPTNGQISIVIADEATAGFALGTHLIDVLLNWPDGRVWVILEPEQIEIKEINTQL
jgi:hypothetical protein